MDKQEKPYLPYNKISEGPAREQDRNHERKGLQEESGAYSYGYDAIGRLESVTKDGNPLRRYGYDAFGNRTALAEKGQETAYAYNALNQLISKKDSLGETAYQYDRRGNLTQTVRNGDIQNQYTYGALNRLERAVNGEGETARYQYNGLGHRVGKTEGRLQTKTLKQIEENLNPLAQLKAMEPAPEKTIRYTIDLTRGYHNLLEKEENQRSQIYLWDGNAAGFYDEGAENPQYYLQDELGSPLRIEGEDGSLRESYGYDEFGRDLYQNQGKVQPFGYTGYQHDGVAGTYFAQAREYRAEVGRFVGTDIIKGFIEYPYTFNEYTYCWNNPEFYVDEDGEFPTIVIGAVAGAVLGGGLSIISDVCEGKKIDLKKAGKNALKGGIAGAVVGSGIGAAEMIASMATSVTGVTVAASSVVKTIAFSAGSGAIYGGVSAWISGGLNFDNIWSGATSGSINGTIVGMFQPFAAGNLVNGNVLNFFSYNISGNFFGGIVGSLSSSYWERIDGKEVTNILPKAILSGGVQAFFSGTFGTIFGNGANGINGNQGIDIVVKRILYMHQMLYDLGMSTHFASYLVKELFSDCNE